MTKKEIKNPKIGKRLTGSAEILLATLVWGYGYIVIRNSFSTIPLHALMTWRYLIAFAVLLILFIGRIRLFDRHLAAKGAVLGFLLYFSQFFQTAALSYEDTTAGKVAFITALYVVIVPFLNWLIFKKKPDRLCILSVFLALPGLFLLTCVGEYGMGRGDILALIGSFGFSVHILAIDLFTDNNDVIALTTLQFGFAAVCAAIVQMVSGEIFINNIYSVSALWPLIYLGIFSTMIGFLMQLQGQKNLSPEISSVLLATESVFGMLFSVLLLDEHLTVRGSGGCILMLLAVVLAERKPEEKARTK